MSLSLRLGRTLNELRQTLTASEMKMWLAYDRISPIGDWRGDVRAAQISAAVINAQGGKVSLSELILKYAPEAGKENISDMEKWISGL